MSPFVRIGAGLLWGENFGLYIATKRSERRGTEGDPNGLLDEVLADLPFTMHFSSLFSGLTLRLRLLLFAPIEAKE